MVLLVLSLAALLVGPVVEQLVRRAAWTEAALDGFVLTALVGLILIHVLPHSVEVAGLGAFAAAGVGFLVPLLLERRLHETGGDAPKLHRWLLVAGFLGYAVHAGLDGLALATGHDDHGTGELLGVAVVLHRIPVGLAIWWLLRPAVGPWVTLAIIATIASSTIAGYTTSAWLLAGLERPSVGLLQALVAGSLLHVALHPSGTHRGVGPGRARASAIGAVLAIAGLYGVATVHPMAKRFLEEAGAGAAFEALFAATAPALLLALLASAALPLALRRLNLRQVPLLAGLADCSCNGLPRYQKWWTALGPGRALGALIASTQLSLLGLAPSWVLLGPQLTLVHVAGAFAMMLVLAPVLGRGASQLPEGSHVASEDGFLAILWQRVDHAAPWILLGLGVAAFIEPLLSAHALAATGVVTVILAWAALGLPAYVCSAAATPIVAVLIHKGLPPGAGLAVLMTAPAISLAGLADLSRTHGRVRALVYGILVYGLAVGAGLGLSELGPPGPSFDLHQDGGEGPRGLLWGAGAVLALLMLGSLVRQGVRGFAGQILGSRGHEHHHDPEGGHPQDGHADPRVGTDEADDPQSHQGHSHFHATS